ncbi:putative dimethylallyl tryptophan synthase [Aspergillus alliaceus]|nr:putative dimethylallyl tryptophan synthase [Aspergillus alliaceus]KAB8233939.1 putative dimethylallyl tryptophan synthase [Aspergillus alliaceus]
MPEESSDMAWRVLGQALKFMNRDQELWWLQTAPFFNQLLIQCGYPVESQYHYLCFYHRHILPVLGPFIRPGVSADNISLFTPEGYPLELSVNYQQSHSIVRLGCGPVSEFAGTVHDPLNQFKARELLGRLALLDSNIDLRWFDYFASQLTVTIEEANLASHHLIPPLRQTNEVAFDLKEEGIVPKGYFFLKPKSIVTGVPTGVLAFDAIERLDAHFHASLAVLKEFLLPWLDAQNDSDAAVSDVFLIGFDCVIPRKSRIKLYVVNTHLSFDNVRALWTLGGRFDDPVTTKGLLIAEKLWSVLHFKELSYADMDADQLPLAVYYEMKHGGTAPKPQLYLPLHGVNDDFIADALTKFFEYLEWGGFAARYKQELISNFPCHDIKQTKTAQRWVSFSYTEPAGVYLTVYFHPVQGKIGSLPL